MSESVIKAKKLRNIDVVDLENPKFADAPTKYRLHYTDMNTAPHAVFVTKEVAIRIKSKNEDRNFRSNFNLYVNAEGVVEDYDSEPKNPNLPFAESSTEVRSETERFLILEKTRVGTITVKHNNGVSPELVGYIKNAAEKHLKAHKDIKSYDLLDEQYFVFDVRNNNRYIYVKPEAA